MGSVGLEGAWGAWGVQGQVVARFNHCVFLGGHRLPEWICCESGPSSTWVSKGNSLPTGQVGHRDRNLYFRQDFLCLLLDLDTVQGLRCLIGHGYSITLLSLVSQQSSENVPNEDPMLCKARRHDSICLHLRLDFGWLVVEMFKCFSSGDWYFSWISWFLIPHLLNGQTLAKPREESVYLFLIYFIWTHWIFCVCTRSLLGVFNILFWSCLLKARSLILFPPKARNLEEI